MDPGYIKTFFSFLFGLIIGSFLNVCIYRIPGSKSIITPSSSCPECGERIRFYDNIPLISFIILFGKCRHCRKPIPIHYPVVELITGLLSIALFLRYGFRPEYFLFLLFAACLVIITFVDLHHQIIPEIISLPCILIGLAISVFKLNNISWLDSLIGIIAGGGFFYAFARMFKWLRGKEGLGGGDVALLAMLGAWMGWRALPFIILVSSLAGTLIGGSSLLFGGRKLSEKIPFGPFLVLGAFCYFFFGSQIINWYYRLLQ
ncbi:MAG: prepilin peptidase [Thermodesulfobacteriota bacterium]|nr:prepilin peptidase [Thermodesulfobacteriota bacterium]